MSEATKVLTLTVAVDEDFACDLTDEAALQMGLFLRDRARQEFGLPADFTSAEAE